MLKSCKADKQPRRRWLRLKRVSVKKGITANLSFKRFKELVESECYYCGGSLPETGSSIDRLDSSKGYTYANSVSCCTGCNRLKGNILTAEETYVIVQALKELRNTKDVWKHSLTTAQKRKRR